MTSRILNPALKHWTDLDSAAKFVAYNRWSLQSMVAFLALVSIVVAPQSWLAVYTMFSAALAVGALHCYPQLRVGPAPRRLWPIQIDYVVHFANYMVGQFYEFPQLTFFSLVVLPIAYFPFTRFATPKVLAATTLGCATLGIIVGDWFLVFFAVPLIPTTPIMLWTIRLMSEAHRSRYFEAQLRVSEERLRFSQDLHDTLGQNLAAMSIKTQLAEKLAQRGDPRLTDELSQIRSLIDTTVNDMRAVAGNYGALDLFEKVDSATALLSEAGVAVTIKGSAEEIPAHDREIAAWFVRETATNVLRHSDATSVTLSLKPQWISVTNDAPRPAGRAGSGLNNLRRRAEAQGGMINVDRTPTSFTATLELS